MSNPLTSVTMGSMQVPIVMNEGSIVIEGLTPAITQNKYTKVAGDVEKEKCVERDPKYIQPKWCPQGLTKTN